MKPGKNQKTTVKKTVAPVVAKLETPPAKPAAPVAARPETKLAKLAAPVRPVTVIEAKIDVGFGNNLFVRGQGAGLSWERGTPLTCVGPDTWRLAVEATDRLKFKLLLNDRVWASGEDVVVPPGKQVEVKPAFSE